MRCTPQLVRLVTNYEHKKLIKTGDIPLMNSVLKTHKYVLGFTNKVFSVTVFQYNTMFYMVCYIEKVYIRFLCLQYKLKCTIQLWYTNTEDGLHVSSLQPGVYYSQTWCKAMLHLLVSALSNALVATIFQADVRGSISMTAAANVYVYIWF